ncbi:FUSC family protein [Sphingomonas echinoides]|uniref:FUSC family protein n=1 Tax=Sphingomonas echinoides TaxID=59803 RepID=UPI0024138BB0|nr:FUSC family protein [Sphingomonas echinoides]
MVGASAAFAAYRMLGLQEGYWSVFTVLIVMQGSIGGTLTAATDRLLGTLIGAVLGGLGAALQRTAVLEVGLVLVIVTGLAAFVAAVRPRLRVAPVTAAIMLLSAPPGAPVQDFVRDRIIEIGIGGVIGVLAAMFVFPARSHGLVIARTATVLSHIARMLGEQARALETESALPSSPEHAALRQALATVEAAMKDADRERATRLADHQIPASVPRTLWRIRNDLVLIGRALDEVLPPAAIAALATPAAAMLDAHASLAKRCAAALAAGTVVDRADAITCYRRFGAALDAFRKSTQAATLDFEASGRVFGLAFAAGRLHRDLLDLASRVDEIAPGKVLTSRSA